VDKKAPIFVSLDTPNLNEAITIADDIKSFVTGVKVGPIFFSKTCKLLIIKNSIENSFNSTSL